MILQTFDPTSQVIQSTARHDVNGFYDYELEQRQRLGYPPFSRLVRLEFRNPDPLVAENEARKLFAKFQELLITDYWKLISVIGPVPCFYAKVGGIYRWQIVLRGADPVPLLRGRVVESWLKDWRVEVDPISLL